MILSMHPGTVKPERFHIDGQTASPAVTSIRTYQRIDRRTVRSAIGDSRSGSAEKRERFFGACADNLEQICRHIINGTVYEEKE